MTLAERLQKDLPNITAEIHEVRGVNQDSSETPHYIEIFTPLDFASEQEHAERMKKLEAVCNRLDALDYRYDISESDGIIVFLNS